MTYRNPAPEYSTPPTQDRTRAQETRTEFSKQATETNRDYWENRRQEERRGNFYTTSTYAPARKQIVSTPLPWQVRQPSR